MEKQAYNPLVSSRPSDTGVTVSLHPLVLLTASDQITRHRVRSDTDPIAGILLGQQKGRNLTAEHAFPAGFDKTAEGTWTFKQPWLEERIQQFRDVHKAPALDVVGWFTLCPESGPLPELVPFQKLLTAVYSDSAILLTIHPEAFQPSQAVNQKLPISVYESIVEAEQTKDEASMQVDGEEKGMSDLKFRPVPYTVETDEAEMIAIDYVAKGAGSAAALSDTSTSKQQPKTESSQSTATASDSGKGKAPASTDHTDSKPITNGIHTPLDTLTTEELDSLATLTTRLNSVKMLQSRLTILSTFLSTLPPSYLTTPSLPPTPTSPSPSHLPHLRSIQSLLTRLSLLTPPQPLDPTSSPSALEQAQQAQANDARLTQVLGLLNHDVQALSELGRKFSTVEQNKTGKKGGKGMGGSVEDMMGIAGSIYAGGGGGGGGGGKGGMMV